MLEEVKKRLQIAEISRPDEDILLASLEIFSGFCMGRKEFFYLLSADDDLLLYFAEDVIHLMK